MLKSTVLSKKARTGIEGKLFKKQQREKKPLVE